jgi:hypothetical protein
VVRVVRSVRRRRGRRWRKVVSKMTDEEKATILREARARTAPPDRWGRNTREPEPAPWQRGLDTMPIEWDEASQLPSRPSMRS